MARYQCPILNCDSNRHDDHIAKGVLSVDLLNFPPPWSAFSSWSKFYKLHVSCYKHNTPEHTLKNSLNRYLSLCYPVVLGADGSANALQALLLLAKDEREAFAQGKRY
jgi:hypothetical protein